MKFTPAIILLFLMIFFSITVNAQAEPSEVNELDLIWNAIRSLDNKTSQIINDIQALYIGMNATANDLILFKNDVNNEIFNLHLMDDTLFNSLNATIVTVQENTDSINVHSQQINDLNQADQGLQNQISGITTNIGRDQLYEVENNSITEKRVYCEDNDDILVFGICPSGFSGTNTTNAFTLFDNFDDQDYTNNPTWYVQSGSWAVNYWGPNSGKLITTSAGGNGNMISTPTPFDSMEVTLEEKVIANNYLEQLHIGISDNQSTIWNGYDFRIYVNGQFSFLELNKVSLGNGTQLAFANGFDLSPGIEYTIKAVRDGQGNWQLFLNGTPVGQTVNDSTYTHFTDTFLLGYQIANAGSQFDDVSVATPAPPVNTSPFLNLNDYNSPMGIECKLNGYSRILCLRQD